MLLLSLDIVDFEKFLKGHSNMRFSEKLKDEIGKAAQTEPLNQIGIKADVDRGMLSRFLSGERPNITIKTIDRLIEYLGLELRPVRSRSKQTEKKTATSRKQSRKK